MNPNRFSTVSGLASNLGSLVIAFWTRSKKFQSPAEYLVSRCLCHLLHRYRKEYKRDIIHFSACGALDMIVVSKVSVETAEIGAHDQFPYFSFFFKIAEVTVNRT